ncbi:hypothetical protein C789_4984 [Microcystis aeruginosa FACHB-905 = DIANCHI905]|nr:hypothetical protein C789_4984 [Microcystis aeruginosa FACHB-905 = DIANCHI905]
MSSTVKQLSVISYQLSVRTCWGFGVLVEISPSPYHLTSVL